MLRCPGDCTVNLEEMRRLTRPANLGFIDPATATMAIQGGASLVDAVTNFFGGLFGKDPDKSNYDYMREQSWNAFATIVDTVDALRAQGRLTQDTLLPYLQAVEKIMSEMVAYTNEAKKVVEASWIDPRFHDFYDFMKQVASSWRAELPSLPGGAYQLMSGVAGSLAGMSPSTMLLLGGAVFLLLSRRRAS